MDKGNSTSCPYFSTIARRLEADDTICASYFWKLLLTYKKYSLNTYWKKFNHEKDKLLLNQFASLVAPFPPRNDLSLKKPYYG